MSLSSSKVYLVTGANKGIGLGLVEVYLKRPNTTVIATVRNIEQSGKAFEALSTGQGSKIIVVAISSTDHESPKKAVELLKTTYGIDRIDTVIANAGTVLPEAYTPLVSSTMDNLLTHYHINTLAPLALFQATFPLLEKSAEPTFAVVSSNAGSTSLIPEITVSVGGYSQSKAAVNHIFAKLASEHPNFNIFPIHPGWVQTDLGNHAANIMGFDSAALTPAESAAGIVGQLDNATIATTSGQFLDYTGPERLPW